MKAQSLLMFRAMFVCMLAPFLLTACAVKPPIGELPDNLQLKRLGPVSTGSPLAWHPDGKSFAVNNGGLVVRSLDGDSLQVDRAEPSAVSWSPTGAYLAAAFTSRTAAEIKIFTADFSELATVDVAGHVDDLAWVSDAELLMAAIDLQEYSFGGNYRVILYRWQQNEELQSDVLADTSPLTAHLELLGDAVFDSVHMRISPYRDEIMFTRLVMPPNAEMHYKLVVRHLTTGAENIIAKLPLKTAGGRYLKSGKRIFFSDGLYQSINRSIWGTDAYETYPPGRHVEISPGGRYKIIDRSFLRDRDLMFTFNDIDAAAFSPTGRSLIFTSGRGVFEIAPLDDAPFEPPEISIKILELRRWRSEGLITPQEYETYSGKLENR